MHDQGTLRVADESENLAGASFGGVRKTIDNILSANGDAVVEITARRILQDVSRIPGN